MIANRTLHSTLSLKSVNSYLFFFLFLYLYQSAEKKIKLNKCHRLSRSVAGTASLCTIEIIIGIKCYLSKDCSAEISHCTTQVLS